MPKWKDIKPTERLNRILASKQTLPSKFAPPRDRSESVDKLFNSSRSRLHSSLQINALNRTREQEGVESRRDLKENPSEKKEELERKQSTMMPTLILGQRQSTHIVQGSQQSLIRSNMLIAQIKKQYLAFKKNVLSELERQREMVQKMIKQIVLTFEFEMEKMPRLQQKITAQSKDQNIIIQTQAKTINEWKNNLASVNLSETNPKRSIKDFNQKQSFSEKVDFKIPSKASKQQVTPPQTLINFDIFLNGISSLRKQLNQMDKMLNISESQPRNHLVKDNKNLSHTKT